MYIIYLNMRRLSKHGMQFYSYLVLLFQVNNKFFLNGLYADRCAALPAIFLAVALQIKFVIFISDTSLSLENYNAGVQYE